MTTMTTALGGGLDTAIVNSVQLLIVGNLGHWLLYALALGYLAGSIPFGLLLTRAAGLGDIRAIGRGRIWADFHGQMDELEHKARFILFRATTQAPDLLANYLDRLIAEERYRRTALADVLGWSPFITKSAPTKVVDLVLAAMLDKLPEQRARERDGMFGWQPHDLDWHAPGVREYNGEFHPASPIREPFKSLFETAPGEGLRLVRALCNHSMEAWRQLHRLTRRDTPLPLRLEFPWGAQELCGNAQTYGWFRGVGGANVVESALMALDAWAFAEVERGRPVDAVIEDVVRNNSCIAVIGIAAAIAMECQHVSVVTLPIATSQRIWNYDLQRSSQSNTLRPTPSASGSASPVST
ncbi:MAG: hypothetical protein HC909_03470 [Blastochloris sp.]|nr:hypothetical protein [Blastochloris sp.]